MTIVIELNRMVPKLQKNNPPLHYDSMNPQPVQNVLWQLKSRQADVVCFKDERGVFVEKTVAPTVDLGGKVFDVNALSMEFRQKLQRLGVPLAEPYTYSERDGRALQISPFIGPDLEKLINEGGFTPKLLDQLLSAMQGVLAQDPCEVGIDARLSNFCLGPQGVVYVDTFPPMLLHEEKYIVHFPNPTDPNIVQQEIFRKFKALGIMRRLRFSILEQDAGISDEMLLTAVKGVMGESFATTVHDYFMTLPDRQDLGTALGKLSLADPDGIRELALKRMPPKGPERIEFLRMVFDLSSNFCALQLSPEERLRQIQEMLLR